MEIRRITGQGTGTLNQFYAGLATDPQQARPANLMLKLLETLSKQQLPGCVWSLASAEELLLLLSDDARGRAFASIRVQGLWYFIECAMSARLAPWPDAWVKGHTNDTQRACDMIVSGWKWAHDASLPPV